MVKKCSVDGCKKQAKFILICPNIKKIKGVFCKDCCKEVRKPFGGLLKNWIKEEID